MARGLRHAEPPHHVCGAELVPGASHRDRRHAAHLARRLPAGDAGVDRRDDRRRAARHLRALVEDAVDRGGRAAQALQARLGHHRHRVRRPPHAVREILRRQLDRGAQPVSDREAPWQSFHDTVDRLLAGIEVPKAKHEVRRTLFLPQRQRGSAWSRFTGTNAWLLRRFEQSARRWAVAPCAATTGGGTLATNGPPHVAAKRPLGRFHDQENSDGGGRRGCRLGADGSGVRAGNQAHLRRSELADRLGSGARALSVGEAGRGGHQGPRQDRGVPVADPDQGHRHVEGRQQRHRRHRLVRAGLLARADAAVGRDVAAVPADQDGGEGQRGALEAVREISRRSRRSTARSSRWCCTPRRPTS